MRNFKLRIEYDGTDFHGWQKQPGLRTVQGLIEDAVETIFRKRTAVYGAGRTDAGVHAIGQVCNFVVDTEHTAEHVGRALASYLPEDIQVREAQEVALAFHARFDAVGRRYVYYLRTEPTAIGRRFAHVVTYPLDLEAMRAAARYLLGEKDFTSFTPTRSSDVPTTCDLKEVIIDTKEDVISLMFRADHFLHHMVRVIVGTLIDVGRGRVEPEHMETILCKKDRTAAGPTIPPNGLF
ncbi:MAG: tRNA pseudouridine(38-40) synthase TruA, partial [Candidatus Latescibacterota bacterium]